MNLRFFVKKGTFQKFRDTVVQGFKDLTETVRANEGVFNTHIDNLFEKYVKLENRVGEGEGVLFNPNYGSVAERLAYIEKQLVELAPFKAGDKVWVKFPDNTPRSAGVVIEVRGVNDFVVGVDAPEDAGVESQFVERKGTELKERKNGPM